MLYTSILWISWLIMPSYLQSEAKDFPNLPIEEGFIADTIIKTIDGYKSIESLDIHDQVMGYNTDTQQYYPCRITAITKQTALNWVKIITSNDVIQAGVHQKFYLPEKKIWILAKDLESGDHLHGGSGSSGNNNLVVNVENIDIPTTLYAITVEQSHFCITHSDVLVHNIDPVTFGTASTIITFASTANPVGVTILGGVLLTGAICLTIHKIWKDESEEISPRPIDYPLQTKDVYSPEKSSKNSQTAIQLLEDSGATPSNLKGMDQDLLSNTATGGSPEPPEDHRKNQNDKKKDSKKLTDQEKFEKAFEYATTKRKIDHFFTKKIHGFDILLQKMGRNKNTDVQKELIAKVIQELMRLDELPAEGVFEDLFVHINGYTICVRGVVHEGIIKIGTMFIPY